MADKWQYNEAGVYVFRTRRPGLLGRIPSVVCWPLLCGFAGILYAHGLPLWLCPIVLLFSNRHTAYVGESMRVRGRRLDHLAGSAKFGSLPQPWADLHLPRTQTPRFRMRTYGWYFLPLPPFKPILRGVETLLIMLLWPVYNHQKNLWNPRRIPLHSAKRQRGQRDFAGWSFNMRYAHVIILIIGVAVGYERGWTAWVTHLF